VTGVAAIVWLPEVANVYPLSLRATAVAGFVAVLAHPSVHAVPAARSAVATSKMTAAVAVPVLATVVVKVLLPQPVVVGAVLPVTAKLGRVTVSLSP